MGINSIRMFGFKSGVGYQLDKHKQEERLHQRYYLRAQIQEEVDKEQQRENLRQPYKGKFDKRI